MDNETLKYLSPDNKHTVEFVSAGEIPFGPQYFKIKIDNQLVANRNFGISLVWHPDSTTVALQEWLTTDKILGPNTALTIVHLENKQCAKISVADRGFIRPILFENGKIIFHKDYSVFKARIIEYEILLDSIKNWEDINYA
ncbi:MAG: hypothetical protein JNL32_00455 [Candidatus Kapabacteria bacterium]|nr:hypothetical protein [Candidatus Kapabacteria bacterium]